MVVTSLPSTWTANTEHDLTLCPLRWTVQAPQLLVSQPITVPVLPSRSRRYWTSNMRGSTSSAYSTPSTVTRTCAMSFTPHHHRGAAHSPVAANTSNSG